MLVTVYRHCPKGLALISMFNALKYPLRKVMFSVQLLGEKTERVKANALPKVMWPVISNATFTVECVL